MEATGYIAKPAIGWARIAAGVLVFLVIGHAYFDTFPDGETNPFNYFGYFTNQTGMGTGAVLIFMGVLTVRQRTSPIIYLARAVATTCMMIVAVIYNGIVPGTGSAAQWVSVSLHVVLPLFMVLDWVFVGDRPPLSWSSLWLVLPYPLIWLTVVLVRGATDGWVPYGFLLPERGGSTLALTTAALLAALLCAGLATWATSRIQFAQRFWLLYRIA